MRLILKHKNKIVSVGLLPIIITLIGLHFLPSIGMLGAGLGLGIIMLAYNITKMKDLNFFLLLGTLGIGLCFLLRLIWGYKYVPLNTITPTVEFYLFVFTFIHYTVPEVYNNIAKRLGAKSCFSYKMETQIIIFLSGLHLISIYLIKYFCLDWSSYNVRFLLFNVMPVSIYIICFIVNLTGIRMAAGADLRNNINNMARIALLCNGKIFLSKKENNTWDLPCEISADEHKAIENYAVQTVKETANACEKLRLIMKYAKDGGYNGKTAISLYVLPVKSEGNIKNNSGRFFSFDEIEKHPELYSKSIIKEFIPLQNAAEMWKEFYSTCK